MEAAKNKEARETLREIRNRMHKFDEICLGRKGKEEDIIMFKADY